MDIPDHHFLLPYGLIVSELGTAYADDEGGLYDWVRQAFGDKWAPASAGTTGSTLPLWIASLAVLFPSTLGAMAGIELGLVPLGHRARFYLDHHLHQLLPRL
ncbi:MAG: hypothetical protein ACLUW6_02595 [Coriobacteriaceae bacterium]